MAVLVQRPGGGPPPRDPADRTPSVTDLCGEERKKFRPRVAMDGSPADRQALAPLLNAGRCPARFHGWDPLQMGGQRTS